MYVSSVLDDDENNTQLEINTQQQQGSSSFELGRVGRND